MINKNISSKLFVFLVSVLLLIVAGIIPTSTTVVPEWQVKIVDKNGNPLPNRRVRQIWKHSSLESAATFHEEDRYSDKLGKVVFPERKITAHTFRRVWGLFKEKIDFLPHNSYGPFATVSSGGIENNLTYQGGSLPGHTIVERE